MNHIAAQYVDESAFMDTVANVVDRASSIIDELNELRCTYNALCSFADAAGISMPPWPINATKNKRSRGPRPRHEHSTSELTSQIRDVLRARGHALTIADIASELHTQGCPATRSMIRNRLLRSPGTFMFRGHGVWCLSEEADG